MPPGDAGDPLPRGPSRGTLVPDMWIYGAFLYGTLLLCGVVTFFTLRRYDLRPLEPWRAVLAATAIGAVLMWASRAGQDATVEMLLSPERMELTNLAYAMIAAVLEEAAKLLTVFCVALIFRRDFQEHSDGIYYGALAGLGAAILESVHVLGWPSGLEFLPSQEPIRLAGHLVMGSITCAALGFFAAGERRWMWAVPVSYLLGCILHTLWDWVAHEAADSYRSEGVLRWHHTAASIFLMLLGLFSFKLLVRAASRLQERHFAPTCSAPDHADTIRS